MNIGYSASTSISCEVNHYHNSWRCQTLMSVKCWEEILRDDDPEFKKKTVDNLTMALVLPHRIGLNSYCCRFQYACSQPLVHSYQFEENYERVFSAIHSTLAKFFFFFFVDEYSFEITGVLYESYWTQLLWAFRIEKRTWVHKNVFNNSVVFLLFGIVT